MYRQFFLSTGRARKLSLNGYQYTKEKDNVTEVGCKHIGGVKIASAKEGYKLFMIFLHMIYMLQVNTRLRWKKRCHDLKKQLRALKKTMQACKKEFKKKFPAECRGYSPKETTVKSNILRERRKHFPALLAKEASQKWRILKISTGGKIFLGKLAR